MHGHAVYVLAFIISYLWLGNVWSKLPYEQNSLLDIFSIFCFLLGGAFCLCITTPTPFIVLEASSLHISSRDWLAVGANPPPRHPLDTSATLEFSVFHSSLVEELRKTRKFPMCPILIWETGDKSWEISTNVSSVWVQVLETPPYTLGTLDTLTTLRVFEQFMEKIV